MSRRRFETDEATTVRGPHGGADDDLLAELLPRLDDHSGPARRLPSSKSAAMVASIVETALREAPAPTAAEPKPATAAVTKANRIGAASPPPRRVIPMLAAALVVAAVVGAAAAVITTRYLTPAQAPQGSPPSPAVPAPAPSARPPAPEAPEIEMPTESIDTPPPKVKKPPPAPREKTLPPDAPAEDVLALANQRRKERAWRDADELYRRVIKQHPRTDAAIVAEVASATLHLEHLGDPAGALAGYRRALKARPSGELGEEARWGIAEAYRAQRMPADEARALRAFLDGYPASALAPAARKRLAELER